MRAPGACARRDAPPECARPVVHGWRMARVVGSARRASNSGARGGPGAAAERWGRGGSGADARAHFPCRQRRSRGWTRGRPPPPRRRRPRRRPPSRRALRPPRRAARPRPRPRPCPPLVAARATSVAQPVLVSRHPWKELGSARSPAQSHVAELGEFRPLPSHACHRLSAGPPVDRITCCSAAAADGAPHTPRGAPAAAAPAAAGAAGTAAGGAGAPPAAAAPAPHLTDGAVRVAAEVRAPLHAPPPRSHARGGEANPGVPGARARAAHGRAGMPTAARAPRPGLLRLSPPARQ